MSAVTDPKICVICAQPGAVHDHHIAGRSFPTVTVPVCESRHLGDWHRALRAAGIDLSAHDLRSLLVSAVVGFRIVLEDGAATGSDPEAACTLIRERSATTLAMIDSSLGADRLTSKRTPRTTIRRPRPRDCAARSPRSESERNARSVAFVAVLLSAIANLLDAILPGELDPLGIPSRLREIAPHTLLSLDGWKHPVELSRLASGIENFTLAELGVVLDRYVRQLEDIEAGDG